MNRFLIILLFLSVQAAPALAVKTIRATLHSEKMGKDVEYAVVLPDSYEAHPERTFPVLYCLHGANAPYDTWAVMAPLNEAIDGEYPAIIVTFQGGSRYIDSKTDPSIKYTSFFFDELVPFIETTYRAGGRRELRGITGFSMGGFGAWHYMLLRPDFFSAVSALSGSFGRGAPREDDELNLYTRLQVAVDSGVKLPPMFLGCGDQDRLLDSSHKMYAELKKHNLPVEYVETEGAAHNWAYWKEASAMIIRFHYPHFGLQQLPGDAEPQ